MLAPYFCWVMTLSVMEQMPTHGEPDVGTPAIGAARLHQIQVQGVGPENEPPLFVNGDWRTERLPEGYSERVLELCEELKGSVLCSSPLYAGHMHFDLSRAHYDGLIAGVRFQQNNCSPEASPVTSVYEANFIRSTSAAFGYDPEISSGYISTGGTTSNLQALWIARKKAKAAGKNPKYVAASSEVHYSVPKACDMLGLEVLNFETTPLPVLSGFARAGELACVVVTLGRTETGVVEPVSVWSEWCLSENVWCHVDAAYGGYFVYAMSSPLLSAEAKQAFAAVRNADSLTFDPHKMGFAPFGAGGFLLKSREDWRWTSVGAVAYCGLDISRSTVEGSRSGAMATSVWFGHKEMEPLYPSLYHRVLEGVEAFKASIGASLHFEVVPGTDLGMVLFKPKLAEPGMDFLAERFGRVNNVQADRVQLVPAKLGEDWVFRYVVMDPAASSQAPELVTKMDRDYEQYFAEWRSGVSL
jgi:glutamate/tyrosine decarboxylase-like PLP-dependent enzyme